MTSSFSRELIIESGVTVMLLRVTDGLFTFCSVFVVVLITFCYFPVKTHFFIASQKLTINLVFMRLVF